jgi:hypothetical protein
MRISTILVALAACSSSTDFKDATSSSPTLDSPGAGDADADADADADSDTDADADTDTTDPVDTASSPCSNPVANQFPADGQVDVYLGSEVFFTLVDADPGATISVTDAAGAVVPGKTRVSGTIVRWSGGPFDTLSAYDATLVHGCGVETAHFETSEVGGDPLAVDPTGLVYAIDLGSGVWAEPVGLGAVLASLLANQQLLLSPTGIDPAAVDFLAGIGVAGVQDTCIATVPMPQTTFADPTFALVAPQVQLDFGGTLIDVNDVDVTGSFAADGGRIQFGTLETVIDTRYLGPAIGLSSAYDEVCNLMYYLGFSCDLCADGLPYCLAITVDDLEAPSIGGALVPREVGDIVADPTCP